MRRLKRLPVIRHFRWAYNVWEFHRWWRTQGKHAIGGPISATFIASDLEVIQTIWEGKD